MKTTLKMIAVTSFIGLFSTSAFAQVIVNGQGGVRVVPGGSGQGTVISGSQPQFSQMQGRPVQRWQQPGQVTHWNHQPHNPHWNGSSHVIPSPMPPSYVPPSYDPWGRPTGPAIVTPNQISGINQATGGLNSSNVQIDHSAFDPMREMSRNNGTKRFVQRPVYGPGGNVIGYQEGYVWRNSVTGQEHGDLRNFTPNQSGGVHQNIQHRSAVRGRP